MQTNPEIEVLVNKPVLVQAFSVEPAVFCPEALPYFTGLISDDLHQTRDNFFLARGIFLELIKRQYQDRHQTPNLAFYVLRLLGEGKFRIALTSDKTNGDQRDLIRADTPHITYSPSWAVVHLCVGRRERRTGAYEGAVHSLINLVSNNFAHIYPQLRQKPVVTALG